MKFYEIINAWNARQRYISPNPLDSAIIPWDIPFTGKQPINMELTFRDMSSPGTILMDIEFCDFHEWKSILVEGKKTKSKCCSNQFKNKDNIRAI